MSNVRQFLDLSTNNLPEHLMNAPLNSIEGVIAYQDEFGAWMYVPPIVEIGESAVPAEVIRVMRYARGLGCDYVRFDRDADKDPSLPMWDW